MQMCTSFTVNPGKQMY